MSSYASMHVDYPGYLEGVSTCFIWGCRVSVDGVVCSFFSCLKEYSVVDRVIGFVCGMVLCFYQLAEICV
jgi:hypothetical protein